MKIIRQRDIDVYSLKIKNWNQELRALIEVQKQIRSWISENFKEHENEILNTPSTSILLNKLIYYISNINNRSTNTYVRHNKDDYELEILKL